MRAEKINQLLKGIYNKDTTTQEEKDALLEACGCVWDSRINKVIDITSFMNMLYKHMAYQYDVKVQTTKTETIFYIKTFKNKTLQSKIEQNF